MPKDKNVPIEQKKEWYESFKAMLRERGYNNPLALSMICVRNHGNPDILNNISSTYADADAFFDEVVNSAQPAFMPVNKNNKLANPLTDYDKPVDWIYDNTLNLDSLSDSHIEYLYNMAADNRLFIKSDDVSAVANQKNTYVYINDENHAELSLPMDELFKIYNQKDRPEKIGNYTVQEYENLAYEDDGISNLESNVTFFVGMMDMNLRTGNKMNPEDEEEKAKLEDYLKKRNYCNTIRDVSSHAHTHSSWYSTKEDSNTMYNIYLTGKKEETHVTQEDLELVRSTPVITADFETLEKSLLRRTGAANLEELASSGIILDEDKNPIVGTSSLDFASKIGRTLINSPEGRVFINGTPYKFASGYGLAQDIKLEKYQKEVEFLVSRLKKTEGNWTKNSPQYDKFSKALKALPRLLSGNTGNSKFGFDELQQTLKTVAELGDDYIDAHKKKTLDSRQISRVKVINRLKDLLEDARSLNTNPGKNLNYKLAEKLFNASAVQSKNQNLLLYDDARERSIKAIMESDAFLKKVNSLSDDDKQKLLRSPDSKFKIGKRPDLSAFERHKIFRQAQNDMGTFIDSDTLNAFESLKLPNPAGLSADRTALRTLAMCKMVRDGFSVADILDPTKLRDEKLEYGQLAKSDIIKGNARTIAEDFMSGMEEFVKYTNKLLVDMPDLSLKTAMDPKYRNIAIVSETLKDISQEMDRDKIYLSYNTQEKKRVGNLQTIAEALNFAGSSIDKSVRLIEEAESGTLTGYDFAQQYIVNCLGHDIVNKHFQDIKNNRGKKSFAEYLTQNDNGKLKLTDYRKNITTSMALANEMFDEYASVISERVANNPDAINQILQNTVDGKMSPKFSMVKDQLICTNMNDMVKQLPKSLPQEPQVQQGPAI